MARSIDDWYSDADRDGRMEPRHDWENDDAPDRSVSSWVDRRTGVDGSAGPSADDRLRSRRPITRNRGGTGGRAGASEPSVSRRGPRTPGGDSRASPPLRGEALAEAARRVLAYEPHLTPKQVAARLREAGFRDVTASAVSYALASPPTRPAPDARLVRRAPSGSTAKPVSTPVRSAKPSAPPPGRRPVAPVPPATPRATPPGPAPVGSGSRLGRLVTVVARLFRRRSAKSALPRRAARVERAGLERGRFDGQRAATAPTCPSCGAPIAVNAVCRCS